MVFYGEIINCFFIYIFLFLRYKYNIKYVSNLRKNEELKYKSFYKNGRLESLGVVQFLISLCGFYVKFIAIVRSKKLVILFI